MEKPPSECRSNPNSPPLIFLEKPAVIFSRVLRISRAYTPPMIFDTSIPYSVSCPSGHRSPVVDTPSPYRQVAATASALAFALLFGCGRSAEPDRTSQHGDQLLRCGRLYDDGEKERFRLAPLVVERDGYDVQVHGIKRGQVVFGLLSGIGEPSVQTLNNVDFFLKQFQSAGVQAVLVAGGLGRFEKHMSVILDRLAQAPVPVLLLPGAEENFDTFQKTIASKRQHSPQLLDMILVRRVRIGNVTVVSIPGYSKAFYLEARGRGCGLTADDLQQTASLFDAKTTTVVFSATPPRGTGSRSVDRGRGGVNLGDTFLADLLRSERVRFGLFGYAYESGGHGTLDDGISGVPQGIWQESLFLQSGAGEAVPLSLVGEGRSVGMAQIVEISGGRGRYHTVVSPGEHL